MRLGSPGLLEARMAHAVPTRRLDKVFVGLYVIGLPATAAMATNPYLEATVRIQDERGHVVIASGPLVFGSLWGYLPAGLVVVLFVFRAACEDRTLRHELAGHEEYTRRTRYRMVPGLW